MYCDVRQWRHIRRCILEKGIPKKRVSRETGVSRRTINKMLTHEHSPSYGPRQRCYPKLRPYIDKINRLRHDATTSSPAANITIQDIVQILRREEGFAGSYDSVRNYIRHLTREDETAWERAYNLITRLPKPRAIDFVRLLSRGNLPVFTSAQIQLFTREATYYRNPKKPARKLAPCARAAKRAAKRPCCAACGVTRATPLRRSPRCACALG
jgi:hypothetical protein